MKASPTSDAFFFNQSVLCRAQLSVFVSSALVFNKCVETGSAHQLCACAAAQIKDAVRDGLRAVKNVIDDKAVVLGAGAFEVAAAHHLRETVKKQVG